MKKIIYIILIVLTINLSIGLTDANHKHNSYYDYNLDNRYNNYWNNSYNRNYNNRNSYNRYSNYNIDYYDKNNNYDRYGNRDDRSCSSWRYWPYSYPNLRNGGTYTSRINSWTATLKCRDWYISVASTRNTSNYRYDRYTNDWTCSAWRYWSYSHPRLANGRTYTTVKWNVTIVLVCNNWYVTIKSRDSNLSNWYISNYNGQCRSGRYSSYSYPSLDNWEKHSSKKYISWWYLKTTLKCRDWYVSIYNRTTYCKNWYYKDWNRCNRWYNNDYYYNYYNHYNKY